MGQSHCENRLNVMFVRQDAATERHERSHVTDAERLHDIEQKVRCWGYLSHYPNAEPSNINEPGGIGGGPMGAFGKGPSSR
jgi:hypothetical protein